MAGRRGRNAGGSITIVVRKEAAAANHAHHGGAWKVAYADFVTAMMAFFLLMWLINATTDDQRRGLADYFSPNASISRTMSGNGAPFGGKTPYQEGPMVSDRGAIQVMNERAPPIQDVEDDNSTTPATTSPVLRRTPDGDQPLPDEPVLARQIPAPGPSAGPGGLTASSDPSTASPPAAPSAAAQAREARDREERAVFERAAEELRAATRSDPQLADLARQLAVDMTPEGLRIQIIDEERQPMFATGSSAPNDRARLLLQKVAAVLVRLPEALAISGHTDAAAYRGSDRSNWELSTERANATRRLLVDAGVPEGRVRNVAGFADRDPLVSTDPFAAGNRRIAIVVLRSSMGPAIGGARPTAP